MPLYPTLLRGLTLLTCGVWLSACGPPSASVPPASQPPPSAVSGMTPLPVRPLDAEPTVPEGAAPPPRAVTALTTVDPQERARLKVVFLSGTDEGGEGVLSRVFVDQGYSVYDYATVAAFQRQRAPRLSQGETRAAQQVGARLGADIVIRSVAQRHTQEKTYPGLDHLRLTIGAAEVRATAVAVASGRVLADVTAQGRAPNDLTGAKALTKAAEQAATQLIERLDHFLCCDSETYRLVVFNILPDRAQELQGLLRTQVAGVQQLQRKRFVNNTLTLDVALAKEQGVAFQQSLGTQLSAGPFRPLQLLQRDRRTMYWNDRTEVPQASDPVGPYRSGYGKSWAVVIGINQYQHWQPLRYAVNDATAVQRRLTRLGFDEVLIFPRFDREATKKELLRLLGDELYRQTSEEDRVFIFFAGHGETQSLPNQRQFGYIIPVEADPQDLYSSAVPMKSLEEIGERLRAKHIFYVIDACFSGLLLQNTRGLARVLGKQAVSPLTLTTLPVRQVLTAGHAGERVVEVGGHGIFTEIFLQGLEGAANTNGDDYITASELYDFVKRRVEQESGNTQHPQFGQFGAGMGEFVFRRPRN